MKEARVNLPIQRTGVAQSDGRHIWNQKSDKRSARPKDEVICCLEEMKGSGQADNIQKMSGGRMIHSENEWWEDD